MKKRLLITGSTGFVGSNLVEAAKKDWDVWGIARHSAQGRTNERLQNVDLCNYNDLKSYLKATRPDAIIHLAAHSNPNDCEDESSTDKLNIHAAINIAGLASDLHIPFSFASTDLVFAGTDAPYDELASPNPINRYGEQKIQAEMGILKRYDNAGICRLPLMFGYADPPAKCMLRSMSEALLSNAPLHLFVDEFRTPVDAYDAAKGLLLSLENPAHCLHLGGRERVSRFEMGALLATALQRDKPSTIASYQGDVKMKAARPQDVSLVSEKAFALGYSPKSPSAILTNFLQKQREYQTRIKAL